MDWNSHNVRFDVIIWDRETRGEVGMVGVDVMGWGEVVVGVGGASGGGGGGSGCCC